MHAKDSIRVIIAEDDFLVSKEISRSVKTLGHEVVAEVSTGEEAFEKTLELNPDVVLMDIQLPGIDGLQTSERIQAHCPTPVIVLTAYDSKDMVERAGDSGVSTYLTKPPKTSEIERAIVIAMARHADLMICRSLYRKLDQRNKELEKALEEIKTLRGILPICSNCKKIRDDTGSWNRIEAYVRDHSDVEFSHSICPECARVLYPGIEVYQD